MTVGTLSLVGMEDSNIIVPSDAELQTKVEWTTEHEGVSLLFEFGFVDPLVGDERSPGPLGRWCRHPPAIIMYLEEKRRKISRESLKF